MLFKYNYNRHVFNLDFCFTAAHCFLPKNYVTKNEYDDDIVIKETAMLPENVTALVGKTCIGYQGNGANQSLISQILINPGWDVTDVDKYENDIAIIILTETVNFTDFVQPICLPKQSVEDISSSGTIAGWGLRFSSEKIQNSENYRMLQKIVFNVIDARSCYTKFPIMARFGAATMFCAGFENAGRSVCEGDSGGGFYQHENISNMWTITGIVSATAKDPNGNCDINRPALFTNVAAFVDWIGSKTGLIEDPSTYIELVCEESS